ncbi:MAG: Bax inhibitor-1/YccA family protein [Acutalibacteraceae bacterium]
MNNNYYGGYPNPQNNYNNMAQTGWDYEQGLAAYTRKTFLWMFIGLAITFGVSMIMAANGGVFAMRLVLFNPVLYFGLALVELILVFILSRAIHKMPPAVCTGVFLAYSAINGITIAPALICYELGSVIAVFAVCAGIFGAMAVYGYVTKRSLAKLGVICTFGLIGILIFSLIGIFIHLETMEILISVIAVIVFMGFTAYDTKKIKELYAQYQGDEVMIKRTAIMSALQLYLDFINMFLYLLRLFGKAKN